MRHKPARPDGKPTPDSAVAALVARQHGVASVRQLLAAGLTRDAVKRRVAADRLHRVYRGVYAVGHTGLSNEGRWMAAVLACGAGAVLSHRSAAEHLALLAPRADPIHVTVPTDAGRARRPGIRLHRLPSLPIAATTLHRGIAVTIPARTIADLRTVASIDDVRRAIREAEFRGLDIGDGADGDRTGTDLELRFLRLCRRHRLPLPEVNSLVGPYEVDFLWRGRGLIVETDGWQGHRGRQASEDDRARDVRLRLLGYEICRFTYRQVKSDPGAVAAAVGALLRR